MMRILMQRLAISTSIAGLSLAGFSGCDQVPPTASASGAAPHAALSTAAIPNGVPVGEARTSAKDGDVVTVVGLIGGSSEPFTKGLAAFTIVDSKVPYCKEAEGCPTPWDYCCEQDAVKSNIALVKVVDAEGKVLEQDAKSMLSVKELSKVTVQGKANRDEAGNMTILANRIHVDQ